LVIGLLVVAAADGGVDGGDGQPVLKLSLAPATEDAQIGWMTRTGPPPGANFIKLFST
jgi:hypothetical protein